MEKIIKELIYYIYYTKYYKIVIYFYKFYIEKPPCKWYCRIAITNCKNNKTQGGIFVKRFLSLFLAVVFAAGALLAAPIQLPGLVVLAAAEETTAPNEGETDNSGVGEATPTPESFLTYELSEDGKNYVVTGYKGEACDVLNIPAEYEGKPVTAIGARAFEGNNKIKSVVIPDSITRIEGSAFFTCEELLSVTISNNVEYIGPSAFSMCTKLTHFDLPDKLKVVEQGAFSNCYQLKTVVLHEGIERIENSAFAETPIFNIDIPKSVTYIHAKAFLLSGVQMNDKYKDGAVLYLNNILVYADPQNITESYIVRKGTTSISELAFEYCENLVTLTIPKSVKKFEKDAFKNCSNLGMIFYEGTLEEFNAIEVANNDEYLTETVVFLESNIDKAPGKVSVKSVSNVANGVQITWNAVSNADFYVVWRRGANTSDWTLLGITDQTSAVDTSPIHRQYWRYSVQAINGAGESPFDYTGKYLKYVATPKLTGISNATNGIYFKWNAVSGASGYRVYRRGAGGNWQYITTVKGTSYTDTAVKNQSGKYYRYTVRAVVDGRYSGYEDFLYTKRLANPKLTSATTGNGGITVKWNAISGTTGYYVYRKTANSNWKHIGTCYGTKTTTFLDKTASKGTTYTYTVRAVYGKTVSYFDSGIKCKR